MKGCDLMSREFSSDLLGKSSIERINYFNDFTVAHPFFMVAYKTLLKRIINPSTKSIFGLWSKWCRKVYFD